MSNLKEIKTLRNLELVLREVITEESFVSKKKIIEEIDPFGYETPEYDFKDVDEALLGESDPDPSDEESITDATIMLRNAVGEQLAKNHPLMWDRVIRDGYKLDFSFLTPEEEQIKKQVYKKAFNNLPKEMQEELLT